MKGDRKLSNLDLSYDVEIVLKITPKLIWKIILALFRGRKIRILYTFTENPFYRKQDMTLDEFYKMAYLDEGWR
jgi:hypothetical protein